MGTIGRAPSCHLSDIVVGNQILRPLGLCHLVRLFSQRRPESRKRILAYNQGDRHFYVWRIGVFIVDVRII